MVLGGESFVALAEGLQDSLWALALYRKRGKAEGHLGS